MSSNPIRLLPTKLTKQSAADVSVGDYLVYADDIGVQILRVTQVHQADARWREKPTCFTCIDDDLPTGAWLRDIYAPYWFFHQ